MFKTIIVLILAVAIVFGILFFWGGNTPAVPPTEQSAAVAEVVSPQPFTGSGEFTIDTASSTLRWEGKKPLLPNDYTDRGTVALKSGTLVTENGALKSGTIVVDLSTIAVASTGTGSGEELLTKALKGLDFFDVAKHPTAELAISGSVIDATTTTMQTVSGTLTIKGITKPISFPATIVKEGEGLRANARVELDRTLWGIRYASGKFFKSLGDKLIADTFAVEFEVVTQASTTPVK